MVTASHQWKLVGPWYRWSTKPEDPGQARASRPVIQKYADSNHVQEFLKNPQHSLKYLAEDVTKTGKRKVFLDTHERFYLVTCELHCDAPGFPKVSRDQVCEAGLVVRKRKTDVPDSIRGEVENLLQEMAYERARLQRIQAKRSTKPVKPSAMGVTRVLKQAAQSARQSAECKHQNRLNERSQTLTTLLAKNAVSHSVLSWVPEGSGLGQWLPQDDELPQDIVEQVYPLYPLIPDTTDTEHASGHKTIWYGLLPVGSSERDAFSNPQFDDKGGYEVRCFVRRHKQPCAKTNQRNDCKGEVVWSRPTESYQLAPHFDLIGTSNRVTMIQAPNLDDLAAQVADPNFKIGQGLGLGVTTPSNSALPIDVDGEGNPSAGSLNGLPSICFFAIPLITIVALFLLRLMLPVVVFLFGLWFLLRLKLCILPQISIDLEVELAAGLEGELALEAELSVSLQTKLSAEVLPQLTQGMRDWFNGEIGSTESRKNAAYRELARMAIDQSTDFSGSGIAPGLIQEIEDAIATDPSLGQDTSGSSTLPNPAERLMYYPTKLLEEVFV